MESAKRFEFTEKLIEYSIRAFDILLFYACWLVDKEETITTFQHVVKKKYRVQKVVKPERSVLDILKIGNAMEYRQGKPAQVLSWYLSPGTVNDTTGEILFLSNDYDESKVDVGHGKASTSAF